ncbi:MAG: hypothetical protein WCK02_16395 [Bacteroidota bacterium]
MKQTETPQDSSALDNYFKEVCYAVNDEGKYAKVLSTGWEVKTSAMNVAWNDIEKRIEDAKQKIERGEASPILFFMELRIMDIGILAAYTGFWSWQVKRHLKPSVFNKLSSKKLQKYATLFEVSIEELKSMKPL